VYNKSYKKEERKKKRKHGEAREKDIEIL